MNTTQTGRTKKSFGKWITKISVEQINKMKSLSVNTRINLNVIRARETEDKLPRNFHGDVTTAIKQLQKENR